MQQETLTAITAMLTGLGIPHGTDPDVLMRTYALAVHGIREDSVREVCGLFIRGEMKAEGYRKGRAPTTDIFATACRDEASAQTARERRQVKQIEPPKPEQPKVSKEKMRLFVEMNRGSETARRKLKEMGYQV